MTKSLHAALADLKPEHILVVYPGKEPYPLHERVDALPLIQLHNRLTSLIGPKTRKKPTAR